MDSPLVSVIVITYNSSLYIEECLDSIYNQTYNNIELIISDDASKDNTIDVCQGWFLKHSDRFNRVKFLTITQNTGVPANLNRGVKECRGEWVKPLAGDDMLKSNAISDYLCFVKPGIDVVVGLSCPFSMQNGNYIYSKHTLPPPNHYFFYEGDAAFQYKMFHSMSFMIGPCFFVRKNVYDRIGFYDERYPFFEDIPFIYSLSYNGIKIYKLDKICVLYRQNDNSITKENDNLFYHMGLEKCSMAFRNDVVNKDLKWWDICSWQAWWLRRLQFFLIVNICGNKANRLTAYIYVILNKFSLGAARKRWALKHYNKYTHN